MENCDCIGETLREDCAVIGTKRGLESSKISGGNVNHMVVIADKKIKHGVTRSCSHSFDKLIDKWWDSSIVNCDCVEGLEIMDNPKGPILLLDIEPVGLIGSV